jgi:hypothetical protein
VVEQPTGSGWRSEGTSREHDVAIAGVSESILAE